MAEMVLEAKSPDVQGYAFFVLLMHSFAYVLSHIQSLPPHLPQKTSRWYRSLILLKNSH